MWSYHQWFGYPFATLLMQEWTHCNPWYPLKYHCSYHIGKWSSSTKIGFSPFPPPHTKTSGYCHHYRQFLNLGGHSHYWFNLYRFGAIAFNNDSTCNNNCHSKQGMILHRTNAKGWFHSLCHRDLQLFPSSFVFLSNFLCTCMYSLPSADLFGTFNVYISLWAMNVNNPTTCASHHDYSTGCHA
jgi:hypothetical protein